MSLLADFKKLTIVAKDALDYLKGTEGFSDGYTCETCRNSKEEGHHSNCGLGKLIKKLEETLAVDGK